MNSTPAISTARRAVAGVMAAATLGTGGIAAVLAVGVNSTAATTTTNTSSSTSSGFTPISRFGSFNGPVQTTTHGS